MRRLSLAHFTVMDADPVGLIDAGAAAGFDAVGFPIRTVLVHVWTAPWVQGVCCMI